MGPYSPHTWGWTIPLLNLNLNLNLNVFPTHTGVNHTVRHLVLCRQATLTPNATGPTPTHWRANPQRETRPFIFQHTQCYTNTK